MKYLRHKNTQERIVIGSTVWNKQRIPYTVEGWDYRSNRVHARHAKNKRAEIITRTPQYFTLEWADGLDPAFPFLGSDPSI